VNIEMERRWRRVELNRSAVRVDVRLKGLEMETERLLREREHYLRRCERIGAIRRWVREEAADV